MEQIEKAKLEAAGYNYNEVQNEVNRILNGGNNTVVTPVNNEIKVGDKVKVTKAILQRSAIKFKRFKEYL